MRYLSVLLYFDNEAIKEIMRKTSFSSSLFRHLSQQLDIAVRHLSVLLYFDS